MAGPTFRHPLHHDDHKSQLRPKAGTLSQALECTEYRVRSKVSHLLEVTVAR